MTRNVYSTIRIRRISDYIIPHLSTAFIILSVYAKRNTEDAPLSRLLFISTKNRWFYRTTMLTCCVAFALVVMGVSPRFEALHRYVAYATAALIAGLTISAPFYKKQFSLQPFMIGIILLPLSLIQIMMCLLTAKQQTNPIIILTHLLVGASILGLVWWMGRLTSPELPPMTHSSIHKWRPWAWLALIILVTQVALGAWVTANFTAGCSDFPFCNGQLLPSINAGTLKALVSPSTTSDSETLTDIQLIHQLGILLTAFYLGVFSVFLLFNRYLYQLAIFMVLLLGTQVILNVYALGWPHPDTTIFYYYGASMLLLITVITLLTNLYRKTQDYWYG
jgi:cytochrome c oxidase assembly protein subunit 15